MSPRLVLNSRIIDPPVGLPRRVRVYLGDDPTALSLVEGVVYDLGPTFSERYRRPAPGDAEFGVEVEAYGDFTVSAEVRMRGQPGTGAEAPAPPLRELLLHRVVLPPEPGSPREGEETLDRPPSRAMPSLLSLPAWSGIALELFVSALLFTAAYLAIVFWPDRSGVVHLLGRPIEVAFAAGRESRLLMLAAATGGVGSLLQAARALIEYPGTRSLTASWARWYLLRPLAGAAVALGRGRAGTRGGTGVRPGHTQAHDGSRDSVWADVDSADLSERGGIRVCHRRQ
jgi:prokaryotic YEATS domain